MAATQEVSITTEVINEVQSYLPPMDAFLRQLAADVSSPAPEGEKELHRMTHTIKGAAAIVQMDGLSKTAALMEDVLDEIIAGRRQWSKDYIQCMVETVAAMGDYCVEVADGNSDGSVLYARSCEAYARIDEALAEPESLSMEEDLDDDPAALLALLGEADAEDTESGDDLFQQFMDPDDTEDTSADLENLLGGTAGKDASPTIQATMDTPSEPLPTEQLSIDQELQESFDEEAEEHLDNISRQLNELSAAVTERVDVTDEFRERLHSIRRSVHTLKGAAAVIGIEPVASWGHDFEDFLDNIHDESDSLTPEGIVAMQDGSDILERIAVNPEADVAADMEMLLSIFPDIVAGSAGKNPAASEADESQSTLPEIEIAAPAKQSPVESEEWKFSAETDSSREHIFASKTEDGPGDVAPVRIAGSQKKGVKSGKRTIRVGSEKISAIMGLGGDMAIGLGSFENAASTMQARLSDFERNLQRLRGVVASFEEGYGQEQFSSQSGTTAQHAPDVTADEFDSLELDRYSELHVLTHSLNEVLADFDSFKSQSAAVQESWQLAVDRQRRVVGDVQLAVQSIQMTPFSTLANRLYKTVRESARVTEKTVRLVIEGGAIEMDTHIWNVLADALMHMLRNCVDHGVESADERQLLGKPAQATIRINCSRKGSRFVLRLSDDGGGLNHDAIRERARILYPDTGVEEMDNQELAALIFKQGFSVRPQATSISGRGVGMDVVRNALDQLDGFIDVYSHSGKGTDFVLSMPIVMAQLPALMVMFGRQQFAVPMRDVNSVLRISAKEMSGEFFELNDESFPLLNPAELMRLQPYSHMKDERSGLRNSSLALAVEASGRRGVLVADAILGQKNVVFKNLGTHLHNTPCVAGATIVGDGSLVPILQTEDLFNLAEDSLLPDHDHEGLRQHEGEVTEILIVDDSPSVRKVLNSFVTGQDWKAREAHDGAHAMQMIRTRKPDLIILDIEMPRMNGFEVLQSLQSQSAYKDIPVLMLTSRSAAKYREKATKLGARGFVTKPFQNEELIALISSLTPQEQAQGQEE
jgi:chemosensory pili system protein ChpA (sensor histidine kinase/response regulator)